MKKTICLGAIFYLVFSVSAVFAGDTGREITNQCRKNLKWLNEMTAEFIKKEGVQLPAWGTYEGLTKNFFKPEYLTRKITPPTRDCAYRLVSEGNTKFQWYCKLHGLIEGDKSYNFRYKEYQTSAKTSTAFKNENFQNDMRELLHQTGYSPTLIENFKYHYNTNPITTLLLVIGFVVVVVIAYKAI